MQRDIFLAPKQESAIPWSGELGRYSQSEAIPTLQHASKSSQQRFVTAAPTTPKLGMLSFFDMRQGFQLKNDFVDPVVLAVFDDVSSYIFMYESAL
ncbi:unnamed protein product [Rotaria sordida]|uniref:Uncharacterized protein n=1 Tax=Rotaria sordida TaxID=392033 RepID=A0A814SSF8_9BILA|nr:unnamed protein product [Rotaria sordida]